MWCDVKTRLIVEVNIMAQIQNYTIPWIKMKLKKNVCVLMRVTYNCTFYQRKHTG